MRYAVTAAIYLAFLTPISLGQAPPEKIQGKTAGEWIETLRTHKDVKFRRVALVVLSVFGPKTEGVLPAVTEALEKDPEEQIRRESAFALERMGADAKGSVYALSAVLKSDKSPAVREAAALALKGNLNPFVGEHVIVLADALNDANAATRAAAAEAIFRLGDKALPVFPRLLDAAKDPQRDRFSRQYAVKLIAKLGPDDRETADVLIAILRDKSAHVALREDAADGLSKSTVAASVVIPPLADALSDPLVEVRRASAAALTRQGKDAEAGWDKIAAALKDSDQAVRYQLIRSAGRLANVKVEAVKALIQQAKKDPHAENRLAAIQELGQLDDLGRDDAVAALSAIREDDTSPAIRNAADAALKKLLEVN